MHDNNWPKSSEAATHLRELSWTLSRILAAVAGLCALCTLAALARDGRAIATVMSRCEPIKPNGVLGILFMSAALFTVERPGQAPRRALRAVGTALATAVLIFGCATLAEYAFSFDLGLDALVFRLPASVHASPRMSPAASFSLAALAVGLLLSDARSQSLRALSHGATLAATTVPLLALLGYAYSARELYQVAHYAPFALPAAFALFLLGFALTCARPDHGLLVPMTDPTDGGRLVRRVVPVMAVSPLVVGWIAWHVELSGLYGPSAGVALIAAASMTCALLCLRPLAAVLCSSERALSEAEACRCAVVESAMDGIVTVDDHGIVASYNPAAERIFGYRPGEVIGRDVGALIPGSFGSGPPRAAGCQAPGVGREIECRRKDGTVFPAELSVGEAELGDRRLYTGIVRDVTERRRAQAELEMLVDSERAARGAAERAAHMKDEFVATISHELRTPLHAMLGWADMLKRGRLDEAGRARALDVIERNARGQARTIEDLLDVSRIVAGKLRLDAQRVELREVVSNAIAAAQPAAAAKGLRLESALSAEGTAVLGDPTPVQQAVDNLLSNAIKFTARGGVVRVELGREACSVEVVVADTGCGIPPDFLAHVFDRFRQADGSTTRRHGGLGLGLSPSTSSRSTAARSARRAPGEGRGAQPSGCACRPPRAARARRRSRPRVRPSIEGVKVLVVDDEADVRELVGRVLADGKAIVHDAGSARAALEEIERFRPDVLLSDIGMPGQDGYELHPGRPRARSRPGRGHAGRGAHRLRAAGGTGARVTVRLPGAPREADRAGGAGGRGGEALEARAA